MGQAVRVFASCLLLLMMVIHTCRAATGIQMASEHKGKPGVHYKVHIDFYNHAMEPQMIFIVYFISLHISGSSYSLHTRRSRTKYPSVTGQGL